MGVFVLVGLLFLFFHPLVVVAGGEGRVEKHDDHLNQPRIPLKRGERYQIFLPYEHFAHDAYVMSSKILQPENWIKNLEQTFIDLDEVTNPSEEMSKKTFRERAIYAYAQFLIGTLSGYNYGDMERTVDWDGRTPLPLEKKNRGTKRGWAYLGVTMIGKIGLMNIYELITDVVKHNIPGHFIETGVWRGGASIFAASLFRVLHQSSRFVILCDSFQGLPTGNKTLHTGDIGWESMQYVAVPDRKVARNFQFYNVLTKNVYFVKGFFNDSLPYLAPHIDAIAVLRLDGDMYQSTVDVMYNLYDKVSVGGYVIVDDWVGFPAKDAIEDFFACHKISPTVIDNDGPAHFKKTEQVQIQRWRYEKRRFKSTDRND